ncbi:MAG: dihydroneopterin aldolase/2-amino-4-hydroxy-6-hydroxymethyldihydropteridine diphosphokinase [Candidatus Aldehydirespiratoraceae bacterium]|jgi:dihydroneopterin aldolase/2-amino-4-hydroxy-6-hydroxymethyldihydropteridine diphosphokinase
MADQIEINGLRVVTIVGALPHEREIPQPLEIDLAFDVDLHDAGMTDELGDTVHYGLVADRVVAVVEESKDILLERLVSRIADEVLAFDRVEAVEVKLTKVRPPLAVDAVNTAVRIRRTRAEAQMPPHTIHTAYVALGSNLGDRESFLRIGVRGLGNVTAMSNVYETDPVGGPDDQGPYLNMVVQVETSLDPFALLRRCQRIEAEAMRQRIVHWGPRTLDVDIVQFDDIALECDELSIPHPRFGERRFVLAPLADIAPDRCPPGWDDQLEPGGVHSRGPLHLD